MDDVGSVGRLLTYVRGR